MSHTDPGPLGWLAALAAASVLPPQVVVAADYLTVEQTQRALFPQADAFREVVLTLTPAQHERVAGLAGEQPPHRSLRAFKALRGEEVLGYVFVDESAISGRAHTRPAQVYGGLRP